MHLTHTWEHPEQVGKAWRNKIPCMMQGKGVLYPAAAFHMNGFYPGIAAVVIIIIIQRRAQM